MNERHTSTGCACLALGVLFVAIGALGTGCTGQIPNSFRLAQREETFGSELEVNTKIDLLWVVDNSASMDVSQAKLRQGFSAFADKYMQPTWDIRVAVITTDTYMAHPAFAPYLSSAISGTAGWVSPHVQSRLASFVNPLWNPTLVNLATGAFTFGVRFGELVPVWGPNWARLLPGLHDGPIPGLCSELLPYFLNGATQCAIRDDQTVAQGPAKCLNPGPGESSTTQCVNTVVNDTVHSGRTIISTLPPVGTAGENCETTDGVAATS